MKKFSTLACAVAGHGRIGSLAIIKYIQCSLCHPFCLFYRNADSHTL